MEQISLDWRFWRKFLWLVLEVVMEEVEGRLSSLAQASSWCRVISWLDNSSLLASFSLKTDISRLCSHWSSSYITALSLVESFTVMLRQLSYAIKNQLKASRHF